MVRRMTQDSMAWGWRGFLVLALAFGAGSGCKKHKETPVPAVKTVTDASAQEATRGEPLPLGDLRRGFAFRFVVYHFAPPPAGVRDQASSTLAKAGVTIATAFPKDGPTAATAVVRAAPVSELPPPSLDDLKHSARGLSDIAQQALQNPGAISVIETAGPNAQAVKTYRAILEAVIALEKAGRGVILDSETRESFSQEAFAKRLEDWTNDTPFVQRHVTLHAYLDGELVRIVSLGMQRFGLPDISTKGVSASDLDAMSMLLNVTLQTMFERPNVADVGHLDVDVAKLVSAPMVSAFKSTTFKNASGKASLEALAVPPELGDADNRLIEVVFPGPSATLQERHAALLARVVGAKEEAMYHANHDDAALIAASKRAQSKALTYKSKFAAEHMPNEAMLVKAPFTTTNGGTEWMWVEVVRWKGTKIEGVLQNDPFEVPSLKAGARVTVEEASIFDYMMKRPDGTIEGNETSKLLQGGSRVTK